MQQLLSPFHYVPGVGSAAFSSDKTRLGWTAGFGSEWQFAPSWSLKSEVLYARFQTEETSFNCTIVCGPGPPGALRE